MRMGLISDIHANREAMDMVLQQLRGEVDIVVCLGDVVGYGPDPIECVERIRSVAAVCLRGNHEDGLLGNLSHIHFNDDALRSLQWQRRQLSSEDQAWLDALPLAHSTSEFYAVHGAPPASNTEYILTAAEAGQAIRRSPRGVCLVGHTHVPAMFVVPRERLATEPPVNYVRPVTPRRQQRFLIAEDELMLINPGSVGQPRDGCPLASFCVIDVAHGWVEFRRVEYPLNPIQERIKKYGLPTTLATRLAEGA